MKHKRFYKVKDSEWVQPRKKNYLMSCCDCGLVHSVDFRIVEDKIQMRAKRAPKYTASQRKRRRIKVTL